MGAMSLKEIVSNDPVVLTAGPLIERLRRDEGVRLDPRIANAALIYNAERISDSLGVEPIG